MSNQAVWDTHYTRQRAGQHYPDENVIRVLKKKVIEKKANSWALDLGSGSGRHLPPLRDHFDRVVAADFTHNSLALCQPFTTELVQATLPELPFTSGIFDFILCWGVLHYLKKAQIPDAIARIRETLKPGGNLFLTLRSDADTHLAAQLNQGDLKEGHAGLYSKEEALAFFRDFSALSYGFIARQPLGEEHLVAHHMILAVR